MNIRLVGDFPPVPGNPRNSEGAFIRRDNGDILFAFSRYHGASAHDHAACDIALTVSADEGETWSQPRVIAKAEDFGTANIMSVSALRQKNGDIAFYFLIKERDFSTTLGRAVSSDGGTFRAQRCRALFPRAYYVVNNDRIVRLSDGRLVAPAAYITAEQNRDGETKGYVAATATCLVSEDDGASFYKSEMTYTAVDPVNCQFGLQEPGILERKDGSLYFWARTNYGCTYECESVSGLDGFSTPRPSEFTSPPSPMQIKEVNGAMYMIYNPVPLYNGRKVAPGTGGRTPFVLRRSEDGYTFGKLNVIEDEQERGYCYPAVFGTRDDCLLIGYCRGSGREGGTLCRLGIAKIPVSEIEM